MPKKTCQYCDPIIGHPWHFSERVEVLLPLKKFFQPAERLLENKFPQVLRGLHKIVLYGLFRSLLAARILKEVDATDDDETLSNRTLVVIREAKKRGVSIKAIKLFGKESTKFFSIRINKRSIIFSSLPTEEIEKIIKINFDDKYKFKKILESNNLPRAEGEFFRDAKQALAYAKRLDFPLAVKPSNSSLSKHVTCNIQSEADLKKAIRVAQIISQCFVVEKFIEGETHRITLINHKMAACCAREAPNVVGDGVHTITELIKIKNEHPRRGESHQKNFTLHKISANENTKSFLAKQELAFESVLPAGTKVYLHNKIILKCGADIHDKTDEIHPDNTALFEKISRLCGAPLIGLDFVCQDISQPYHQQKCAVLEANSLPYIDMHHYPTTGKPRNVAGLIMDYALKEYI